MIAKKSSRKVETYGRRKDYSARFKVLSFFAGLLVFTVLLAVGASFINDNPEGMESVSSDNGAAAQNIEKKVVARQPSEKIDFQPINFDFSILETDPLVQDLPKKAVISLNVGGNYYTITKSSVVKVKATEPDLTISIPGRYLEEISGGLCETVKKANANGDLVIQSDLSEGSLAWKYKSMLKYKDCLGM